MEVDDSDTVMVNSFAEETELDDLLQETNEEDFDDDDEFDDLHEEVVPSPRKLWLPTGCCYDDRMKLHANAEFAKNPIHPEDPRRIEAIMREFKEAGLLYTGSSSDLNEILATNPTSWMYRIAAREATKAEICTVHTATHYAWVEDLSRKSSAELREMTKDMDQGRKSLYVGNLTYEASLVSVGGAIETCKNIVEGKVRNAIAVIRPPGHHAEHNESMGFCLFNNVSVAAEVCKQDYPETCKKIMILDWDVHHGNGVQNIFYEDPNVLYISLHVYGAGDFYPGQSDIEGLPDGGLDKCGAGAGIGRNVNIGWATQDMGDGEYMAAFQRIVMPIAREFDPDLVIVAAGFDAAEGDDLGNCHVTPQCYAHMTHMLMSLADGKLAVCLEGGYNLSAISRSALAVAKTLMGEPPPRITIPPINIQASQVLDQVKDFQSPYWDCLRLSSREFAVNPTRIKKDLNELKATPLGEVIRGYQKRLLVQNHQMVSLYILREKISKTFQDQVLITQDIQTATKIFLVIHDPPELLAISDPVENRPTVQDSWIADGVMPYIDWAAKNGFGVIDVNIPMTSNTDHDPVSLSIRDKEAELQSTLTELVCYIWDNYLELSEATEICLMGVGYSYLGVKMLLTSREVKGRITAILNYVTGALRAIRTETDPALSHWYKEHSRVYVAADHLCWSDEDFTRKVRKNRFGRVVESSEEGLNRMLNKHLTESTQWLAEMARLGGGEAVEQSTGVIIDGGISRPFTQESIGQQVFGGMLPGRMDPMHLDQNPIVPAIIRAEHSSAE